MRSQSRDFEKAVGFRAKIKKICDNPLKIPYLWKSVDK